jgi:hypothetical protein
MNTEAKKLWDILGDCPINDNEELDDDLDLDIIQFEKGTDIYEIWHWFEEKFNISVTELMFSNRLN